MKFFKGIFRLIPTVLLHLAMLVVVALLGSWFSDDTNVTGVLAMPIIAPLVVCVVNQVLYEVLDWGILDNVVGRGLKAFIFFVSCAIALIVQLMPCVPSWGGVTPVEGFVWNIFYYAITCSGGVAVFMWSNCIAEDEEEGICYIGPMAVGYSLIAGLVLQIVGSFLGAELALWIGLIGSVGLAVFAMLKNGIPYTEIEGVLGHKSSSYSSSSSGGYRSGSSSSSSSSSSGYRTSSSSGRTVDNYGQLESRMKSIASRNSGTQYVYAGTKLFINVRASVVGTQITFTISAEYGLMSNVQQSDISYISDDIQRALRETRDSVLNEADSEIDELREQYTNYDKDYNIATRGGDIKKAY